MKKSVSQIFNSSSNSQNKSIMSIYSLLKNNKNNKSSRIPLNGSFTCLNFPKLYPKLKYSRNKNNNDTEKSITKINTALKIYHYPEIKSQNKQLSQSSRYNSNSNIHNMNNTYNTKLIPLLFFKKRTLNDYLKKFELPLSDTIPINENNASFELALNIKYASKS